MLVWERCGVQGVVPFPDMLWTLNRYRTFGFRPEPGTVVESLDASMSWKSCVVTHTYVEMNDTAA